MTRARVLIRALTRAGPVSSGPAALAVEGLCSGYGGGDILHDVSFTVPEGGLTCIVGPNGAGKSTLLASISGLLRPRRGRVLLRGEPVTGRTPRQILDLGVVHVPQQHSLFRDMTVAENLDLGGYTIRDRAPIDFLYGGGMSVSPDERYVLLSRQDLSGSDLMLVNNFR